MNFLDMSFSTLFKEKHGKKVFNVIANQIENEINNKLGDNYLEIVFKVALFNFWGLKDQEISKLIEDFMKIKNVDIKQIKVTHENSIKQIQKYLKEAMNKAQ